MGSTLGCEQGSIPRFIPSVSMKKFHLSFDSNAYIPLGVLVVALSNLFCFGLEFQSSRDMLISLCNQILSRASHQRHSLKICLFQQLLDLSPHCVFLLFLPEMQERRVGSWDEILEISTGGA